MRAKLKHSRGDAILYGRSSTMKNKHI